MSKRYPGGIITKTPVTPAGPYENSAAPGVWTLDQALQYTKQGIWPTAGNQDPANLYIEYLFSTYLYTGTDTTQTFVNNIDLSTKGGMIWFKDRGNPYSHYLVDTVRGRTSLASQTTAAQTAVSTVGNDLVSFNTNGFTVGTANQFNIDGAGRTYVSWTFREQPKFFDVVTYTGTGSNTTIAHALGAVPGSIIVKRTDTSAAWAVYHRSLANTQYLVLNDTAAAATGATWWNSTTPTSAVFSVGTDATVNASSGTYVAYVFAHDAGGFGLTGTDNVISCGSFTTDGSGNTSVTLGYEPQWVMVKRSSGVSDWLIFDTMRGMPTAAASGVFSATLLANSSAAEDAAGGTIGVNSTGFNSLNGYLASSSTFIYIAIRRGPMQTPTVGTSVFTPTLATFSGTTVTNTGYVVDMVITKSGVATTSNNFVLDRLRGSDNGANQNTLPSTSSTSAEVASSGRVAFTGSTTIQNGFLQQNTTADNIVWAFGRAPSFFDEVCYTGNSTASTAITHNLGVVPELIIVKSRSAARNWPVYIGSQGNNGNSYFNRVDAWASGSDVFANTTPTASEFYVGNNALTNNTAETYVAYLFATCAGVSKVGSYTGNGTTQTINCGFGAGGARFVLLKRTDSTGGWYVYDTARGMTVLTDPYLLLNSTAVETATLGSVTTVSTGFALNSTILADINVSAGTYIFLAIA